MSMKDEFLILLEVVNKPNIRMLMIPPKPVNNYAHDMEMRVVPRGTL